MLKRSLLCLLMLSGACLAQQTPPAPPPAFYRLDFAVKDVEGGKTLSVRNYSAVSSTEMNFSCQIRTGSRVPVSNADNPNNWTYIDVGVSIDCRNLQEVGGELAMSVTADISSTLQEQPGPRPLIRQNKWSAHVVVPLRKPTVIFSSDDNTTHRQMQLELTATPIGPRPPAQ